MQIITDRFGSKMYAVYNDAGDLLIYTSNLGMAQYVDTLRKGAKTDLRLRVGGDAHPENAEYSSVWRKVKLRKW
jgi:hypothetical protein